MFDHHICLNLRKSASPRPDPDSLFLHFCLHNCCKSSFSCPFIRLLCQNFLTDSTKFFRNLTIVCPKRLPDILLDLRCKHRTVASGRHRNNNLTLLDDCREIEITILLHIDHIYQYMLTSAKLRILRIKLRIICRHDYNVHAGNVCLCDFPLPHPDSFRLFLAITINIFYYACCFIYSFRICDSQQFRADLRCYHRYTCAKLTHLCRLPRCNCTAAYDQTLFIIELYHEWKIRHLLSPLIRDLSPVHPERLSTGTKATSRISRQASP